MTRVILPLLLVLLGAFDLSQTGRAVAAEGYFKITYTVDRSGPKEIRLVGSIVNEAWLDVKDVRLRVQALDAAGKVVAEPRAFVDRFIKGRGEGYWEATMTPDPRIVSFRVYVVGYRYQVYR
jgi:hypothetical protein